MKHTLLVNDLSCFGKVALKTALPILSLAQIDVSTLPTVLLSAHTGMASPPFRQVLTNELLAILSHWSTFSIEFSAILTGYLGNEEQIDVLLNHLPTCQHLIVDPVMADNGKLYSGFLHTYPLKMKQLCAKASVITPNYTEACLLTNQNYSAHYCEDTVKNMLYSLTSLGPRTVIITSVPYSSTETGVAYLHDGVVQLIRCEKIDGTFFGTGDLFSALLTAGLLNDKSLDQTIHFALSFIRNCLLDSLHQEQAIANHLIFEKQLHTLYHFIKGEHDDKKIN